MDGCMTMTGEGMDSKLCLGLLGRCGSDSSCYLHRTLCIPACRQWVFHSSLTIHRLTKLSALLRHSASCWFDYGLYGRVINCGKEFNRILMRGAYVCCRWAKFRMTKPASPLSVPASIFTTRYYTLSLLHTHNEDLYTNSLAILQCWIRPYTPRVFHANMCTLMCGIHNPLRLTRVEVWSIYSRQDATNMYIIAHLWDFEG
jgi:hypothetical protein